MLRDLDLRAGFLPLAFGSESLFFAACTTLLPEESAGNLELVLSVLACAGFLTAWLVGERAIQSLVLWLLIPTVLSVAVQTAVG